MDNALMCHPWRDGGGAHLAAVLGSPAIAFVVTVPVNRWLIARGKGHAVVHQYHH